MSQKLMYFDVENLELNKVIELIKPFCQTNKAKEIVSTLSPSNNLDDIKKSLDLVEEAYACIVKLSDLPLGGFKDRKDSIIRASIGSVLSVEELYDIAYSLQAVRNVIKYKSNLNNLKTKIELLNEYFSKLTEDKKIETEIFSAISPELKIQDNASIDLFKIRKRLRMEETHLRNFMNSYLTSKASMLQENLIAIRDGHFTVPVKAEFKNQIKGVVRDSSSSGTTYFIEPEEAYQISAKIDMIKADEKKEINQILKNLSLLVNSISENLITNHETLIELDIIFAKAGFALKNNMIKPSINDQGIINIKAGAHPLIDSEIVVKNDVSLGKDYDTIIITGPNTGGKTVLLKMVGLLTLMMQSGLFVPAKEGTVLNVFDNVFSDIGDEQSIEQNLSTFSGHMTNVSSIIDRLTYNSLVLLDELGSGTDPKEGASLAIAIIDYLTKKGARTITTTHYSDLKAFAYNNPRIINASVEFKVETLKPTYKLQMGIPGRSNAILISKRLGLREDILNEASNVLNDSMNDTSQLINKIDEENERINAIKEEYEEKINEYNILLEEVINEKNKIQSSYDRIIKKAKADAQKIVDEAKEDAKKLIDELNELKTTIYYEEHKLADAKHKLKNLNVTGSNEDVFDEVIKVGDIVFISSYNRNGEVKKIKGDRYEVQVGQFAMTFKKSELKLAQNAKPKTNDKPKKKAVTTHVQNSQAKMTLDLRGYRYDEVARETDLFLDQAAVNNMGIVYIIHGFGTGAVREALYAYLKKCPYVKSYRFGGEGEGLNGCTVVTLK